MTMTAELPVSTGIVWTRWDEGNLRDHRLERTAHELVARHYCFRGRADNFEFTHADEVLTVRGRVPTFYLKQMLQTMLMNLRGVSRIDNQVDVVSSHGLSSVRK